jgi:hypothetical protein
MYLIQTNKYQYVLVVSLYIPGYTALSPEGVSLANASCRYCPVNAHLVKMVNNFASEDKHLLCADGQVLMCMH